MVQILQIQMGHVVLLGIQKPVKMINQLQSLIMVTGLTSKFYFNWIFPTRIFYQTKFASFCTYSCNDLTWQE